MAVVKKALIVGIASGYPPEYRLQGCVNDANDLKATLQANGFSVTTLLDVNATRSKILSAMNTLFTKKKTGDMLILAGSGHGSQRTDTSGDEPDALDECFVSVDMQAVTDDDIRAAIAKAAPGTKVDVAFDCCHSGTLTRNMNPMVLGYKSVPPSAVEWPKETVIVPTMSHVLWAACRPDELAAEISVDGVPRGAFAYPLCQAWRAGGTRSENIAYCEGQMARWGLTQHPQLELPQSKADQPIFG